MKIFIIKFKKYLITILLIAFLISLIILSESNIESAKKGIYLWGYTVVPSLFPFFIATDLLYYTNIINILEIKLGKYMKKIFNLSSNAVFPIIMGSICGYPTGAKIISNLRENKKITKIEGEHLLAFTNNSGPLFIIGTIGSSIFCNKKIGIILLIAHLLGAFSVGIILKFWKPNRTYSNFKNTNINSNTLSISNILVNSISKSVITILNIGGFIVLFSVIISILNNSGLLIIISGFLEKLGLSKNTIICLLCGIIEITNGLNNLSIIGTKNLNEIIIITSFLLGFGGISVLMQVYSCISKTDLSIKPYFWGKILHGLISAIYTFIIIKLFN